MKTKAPSSAGKKKLHKGEKQVQSTEVDKAHALIERRIYNARTTKRLDLSTTSSSTILYQLFPRQLMAQCEQIGHHLCELWLTNHRITIVPPEIASLKRLRVLGLGGNCLSTLPEELVQLTNLESLYLERNQIKTLPTTFQFPRQLRHLRLDENALTEFPLQITNLRLLNTLGLSHNHMTCVPPQIRRLINLVTLDMDHNELTTLPEEEMICLQHLEQLGLEGNCLENIPVCLERMPRAMHVRLSGNMTQRREGDEARTVHVPRRHDGYYQTMQGYQLHKQTPVLDANTKATDNVKPIPILLHGTIPCREQNIINNEYYRRQLSTT